ncbi:hypothetical protein [Mesorhizobium sp.]|uniref:hypothetical protein n=1 Tax=Mesorhizobium sp. TaxID=1871066 RepID=UPI000FE89851|nr:hypothetical protein [Mesorhizobium sp.]RWJ05720.1 MAG: hypothetical protein EOR23_07745 [Mesorhizobium sp.]
MAKSRAELLDSWIGRLRGRAVRHIPTPALLIERDTMGRKSAKWPPMQAKMGLRLSSKTHKSVDIARLEIAEGACGICSQKISGAEAMVEGGIDDVLISNHVVNDAELRGIARLAQSRSPHRLC